MFPMSCERRGVEGDEFRFGAYQQGLHILYQFMLALFTQDVRSKIFVSLIIAEYFRDVALLNKL
jgi:hypothetical protein